MDQSMAEPEQNIVNNFFSGPLQFTTTHTRMSTEEILGRPRSRMPISSAAADGNWQHQAKAKPDSTLQTPPSEVTMDTFFLSHGAVTVSVDETIPVRSFFKSWLPAAIAGTQAPRAILMVSGHWDTATPTVNVVHGTNDNIYDFHGFPEAMYKLKYPAPGAPDLAERTKNLLEDAGFGPVSEDHGRGLDHGAWVPLMLMYPEADIPVCQLSVQSGRDGTYHYNLGKALAPLRDEGVLIIGTGTATHNMSKMGPHDAPLPQWALEFDAWLKDSLLHGRYEDVKQYEERAPYGKVAHPEPDHFYPLHVALGAAGDDSRAELIHHSWTNACFSYASYRFTTNK